MYYTIVDVIVRPQDQGRKVGTEIINRQVDLINRETVAGEEEPAFNSLLLLEKKDFMLNKALKFCPMRILALRLEK